MRKLSGSEAAQVDAWWRGLAARDRRELRRDAGRPPIRVVGRFVEPGNDDEVSIDFYEYLVNHEIYINDGPMYHICSAHPEARAAISKGRIPATFVCPRREKECPMRKVLDERPGYDVRFSLRRGGRA